MTIVLNASYGAEVDTCEKHVYQVVDILDTTHSALIFTAYERENTQQKVVMKVLRAYEDTRYRQATSKERLECQREALRKNLIITPDVYQGLEPLLEPTFRELEEKACKHELQSITLGKIARDIDEFDPLFAQEGEYALVMAYLPEKRRLNSLLREESTEKLEELLELLIKRVARMHSNFSPLGASSKDKLGNLWGSHEQLKEKLEHNLMHFDFIEQTEHMLYQKYNILKVALRAFIQHPQLLAAFEERQPKYVKQCHGDLKASNIWIETVKQNDDFMQNVSILDAVDCNESYRNIDVLADLAMLVVDIEANGVQYHDREWRYERDYKLATDLLKEYLLLTNQAVDATVGPVLRYYLIEKAIVRAIMCLIYDRDDRDERQLGKQFLDIAIGHARFLSELLEMSDIGILLSKSFAAT
jgi:aminoglycoside phosphotransferase family enzyme